MSTKEYRQTHKEEIKKNGKLRGIKLKTVVLSHYGNGKLACVRCGETDLIVLCLDHINGGGKKERQKYRGRNWYSKLIKENFPTGYQTLCANCNLRKTIEEDIIKN